MKKYVLSLLACLFISAQFGFAQSISMSEFLEELSNDSYCNVLQKISLNNEKGFEFKNGVPSFEMYILNAEDKINNDEKARLVNKVFSLEVEPEYTNLIKMKSDSIRMDAYMKLDDINNTMDGIVFMLGEDGSFLITRIFGDVSEEEVMEYAKLMSGQKN